MSRPSFPAWAAACALCMFGSIPTASAASAGADLTPPQGPPVEEALVAPPGVPQAIHANHPVRVIVRLETHEEVKEIADGVRYDFWTFNGTVPGPMIRVRQGDTVELHFRNDPRSHMSHNIDLHAVMGPGGGAAYPDRRERPGGPCSHGRALTAVLLPARDEDGRHQLRPARPGQLRA